MSGPGPDESSESASTMCMSRCMTAAHCSDAVGASVHACSTLRIVCSATDSHAQLGNSRAELPTMQHLPANHHLSHAGCAISGRKMSQNLLQKASAGQMQRARASHVEPAAGMGNLAHCLDCSAGSDLLLWPLPLPAGRQLGNISRIALHCTAQHMPLFECYQY